MANLLDGLLPGNRVVTVNGVRPAVSRDTLEIEAIGAGIIDDVANKRTIVQLPNAGASTWGTLTIAIAGAGGGGTIGNGSVVGLWRLASVDTAEISMTLTFGSTTSFGSGALDLLLGVQFATTYGIDTTQLPNGQATSGNLYLADSSTPANNKGGAVNVIDQTTLRLLPFGTATEVGATSPFTWAVGDTIRMWVSLPVLPVEL